MSSLEPVLPSFVDRLRALRIPTAEHEADVRRDPARYWALAAEALDWRRRWDTVFEQPAEQPWDFAYFKGGRTNVCDNAVDRHVRAGWGDRPALVWESDPAADGDSAERRVVTYAELLHQVNACAAAYRRLGLGTGDRIALYLPNVPETTVAMLAAARLGVVYTAVFPGLSAEELRYRLDDLGAALVVTSDVGYRRGEEHAWKAEVVDRALEGAGSVRHVIVVDRSGRRAAPMAARRDVWWDEVVTGAEVVAPEPLDAEHPLFVLYTSGSTGRPKGAVHTTAGYAVGLLATMQAVFGAEPGRDVLFTYADPGWITGQSYTNYAPLLSGLTTVLYEGVPDWPRPDRFWRIVQRHRVTLFKIGAPGLRLVMRHGAEWPRAWDRSSLRWVCSCAEPLDPVVQAFVETHVGPVLNAYWKTEDGGIHFAPLPGVAPQRPDASTRPLPWTTAEVVEADETGKGHLVTRTHPYMMRTLWNDHDRYVATYWSRFPGWFLTGDFAIASTDGYVLIPGRSDDVIKISGHRIGTREIEECLIRHPAVGDAIAVGIPNAQDPNTDAVVALVVLAPGHARSLSLDAELDRLVREGKGAVARLAEIYYGRAIPRTKSGKNLRRVLRTVARATPDELGRWAARQGSPDVGNVSTLENRDAIQAVVDAVAERRALGEEETMRGDPREIDGDWWRPEAATLPVGAPFRPGLDPLPAWHHAWALVKDRWGRPAHGEPRDALRRIVTRVPSIGPHEALGYVLYAGLTYNTVFAARGVPISVFDLHDEDAHVPGSGAVVLVAALGSEAARDGRLRVGELRVLYPGVSNLLSPRAGEDPMYADFSIQGYETPDGSFAQFVRGQAPQLLAHSERLTLAEGSSYMLDLETVFKALYDVAGVGYDERVFVEGAAGGTGLYAVACAVLRGARVTGLVSTEDKGRLVLERGARAFVNRALPELAGIFAPVPVEPAEQAAWRSGGLRFLGMVREKNQGAPIDVVVSSVGRDLFPRMVDLLGPGGRLVFYGATSGYTLTFLGKQGAARAGDMYRRAGLRPAHGVLVHYGVSGEIADTVGVDAISAAVHAGARVVAVTRTDAQAAHVQAMRGVRGAVSLETLGRSPAFAWPGAMPDYDRDPDGFRAYQERTLKPFGQAVGRLLATPDNPRGHPDVIVERGGQDTLGVSAFLARPFTGRVVYLESTAGQRLSFFAPNVWMHQKRILFPALSILGSHLSNAHQADEVVRLLDQGALAIHAPQIHPWDDLAEANQAIHDNRHTGTLAVRVGATTALDGARTAREVFAAWGSRVITGKAVHLRLDPVRAGAADQVALVTVDVPPANTIGRATLEDLERALDVIEQDRRVKAAVLTGAGTMFVAGADIRQLRAFGRPEEVVELATRAQRVLARIARCRVPIVAAVDGYALGGGNELQMACGYRVASARAALGQPEINLHVVPGFGGTQMLPRLAIRHAAASGGQTYGAVVAALTVLLDGRRRSAARARALGLVDEVAPADALSHALALAGRIARGEAVPPPWSPLAESRTIAFPNVERDPHVQRLLAHHDRIPRAAAARAIVELVRTGLTRGLEAGLAAEAAEFGRLVASEAGRAGIDRFLARRPWPLPIRTGVDP
jgi:acyl-coenzyme A synthetase/AMP-(fatty) acid ligase/enoyl-CoA hydratase/carnithine racemase/NADPH:quinone reductase-like Zn-dependent oxidoreductase